MDYMSSKRLTLKEVLFLTTSVWILMGSAAFGAPTAQLDKATFRDSPPTGAVKDASEVKTAKDAEESSVDGFKKEKEEKDDKKGDKLISEEIVEGVKVNGQDLYKGTFQDANGQTYTKEYYYLNGEQGSNFISVREGEGYKWTTMNTLRGANGEVGSIQLQDGRVTEIFSDKAGYRYFNDGQQWMKSSSPIQSGTPSEGMTYSPSNGPGSGRGPTFQNAPNDLSTSEGVGPSKSGQSQPVTREVEGWSRGASSGSEVFRGGSPVEVVTMGAPGGAPYTVESAMQSFDGSPPTIGKIAGPTNIQAMEKYLSSLSSAQLQTFMKDANELAASDFNGCIGCAMQHRRPGAQ